MYEAKGLLATGKDSRGYDGAAFDLVMECLRGVLTNHYATTLELSKDDYDEVVRALEESGWNPIKCPKSKKQVCKEMLAQLTECQIFYNCATKKKYAFLGYKSSEKQQLLLRVLG